MSKATEKAYQAIHKGITDGTHSAGTHLREGDLSADIGVSRTPVREALRRLAAEGIVEFLPNRGAHVASWSDEELSEIFELRALLESYGAGRAATRIEPDTLVRLIDLADQMEAQLDHDREQASFEISKLNNEFHRLVLESSGSRQLVTTAQGVIQTALVHHTFIRYDDRGLRRSFSHHRELIEALSAGDPLWARSVMRSHVLAARSIFGAGDDTPDA